MAKIDMGEIITSTAVVLTNLVPTSEFVTLLPNDLVDFSFDLERLALPDPFSPGESRHYTVECLASIDGGLKFTSLATMEIDDGVKDSMEPGGAHMHLPVDKNPSRLMKTIITRIAGVVKLQTSADIK